MTGKVRTVAPSDLSYMYDKCPRCYWLKANGIVGPSDVLPGIFRDIDRMQKEGIGLESLRALGIPAAKFIEKERVVSKPAEHGGSMLVISGYTDRRVRLDDGTLAIIDFKTSKPRVDGVARFWRAMSAYQYAIENNSDGSAEQVTLLSLVVFSPSKFKMRTDDVTQAAYTGSLVRMDVPADRPKFDAFLRGLGETLASTELPRAGSCDTCRHCDEVVRMRMGALLHTVATNPELGPDMAAAIAAKVQL